MNPGPAPTLLNDYMTSALMWAIVATFCAGVVVWMATEFLKTWHAKNAELDKVLAEGPPPFDDTCCIQKCTRPGVVPFNTPNGVLFACRQCAGIDGDWVGRGNQQPYDQDLDPATDLAKWEKEMPA